MTQFVFFGVEHVQDDTDQQRVARFLPLMAPFKSAFGIDQDIGDVLDFANLVTNLSDCDERVVPRARWIGRIKQ